MGLADNLADKLTGTMPGLDTEQQKKYIKQQQLFGLAAAIMQASAPSTDPRSGNLGYALGKGLEGMNAGAKGAIANIASGEQMKTLQYKRQSPQWGKDLSDTQLYSVLVHSSNPDDRKKASAMLAFRRAQGGEVSSTTTAKRTAEAQTAAELERQKIIGQGNITPIQKKEDAQKRVSDILGTLKGHYENLDKQGAIVNVEKGITTNALARLRSSGAGQLTGKAVGTEEQSIRNQINQIKPLLINHIRQASEMGARGLDSEKELAFYLQSATDPGLDIQMNLAALKVLENAYGLKQQEDTRSEKKPGGKRMTFNPKTGRFE